MSVRRFRVQLAQRVTARDMRHASAAALRARPIVCPRGRMSMRDARVRAWTERERNPR